jgi:two-component system cell cycle sensor histidine kinase/response regulator CckA
VNAHEAMPDGGELTIGTENVTLDEGQAEHRPGAYPGTFVRLSVSDTGSGIEDEVLPKIFEPFFSTRETGSGLGLSIVQNTVEQCDGWIEVVSEVGRGSTFHIFVPVFWTDLESESPTAEPQPELRGHGERILLVEDNDRVRAAISEMLRAGGYEVLQAADAGEAIEVFEQEKGNLHMVISDVVLPNRNGLQLVEQLHAQAPGLPVLLTSGYTDQQAQWPAIRERGLRFLQKPFSLSQLLPIVREVLTGQQPPGAV